jgi:hypothetical protein
MLYVLLTVPVLAAAAACKQQASSWLSTLVESSGLGACPLAADSVRGDRVCACAGGGQCVG